MRMLRSFLPPADVHLGDGFLTLTMDVPGFSPDQVEVELNGNMLAVRGERVVPTVEKDDKCHLLERGFGRFQRVLQVPDAVDPDAIEASLTDGVLTLRLPLPEAPKPHRIALGDVSTGEPATLEEAEPERELATA